jgi:spermidine synthase
MKYLPHLFYGLSGFCFLSIETIWIRTCGLFIGHTVTSATLVITVFFLMAALGNLFLSKKLPQNLKTYGWLEIACGLSAAICFLGRDLFYETLRPEIAFTKFLYVGLLVAIPSFLSGATFPALSHALITKTHNRTEKAGAPYSFNLMGAALGVMMGGLFLPEHIGYQFSFYLSAAGLVFIGILAVSFHRHFIPTTEKEKKKKTEVEFPKIKIGVLLFSSGFFSLLLEILITKYFLLLSAASMHAISAVFFAFILNLGLGSYLATNLRKKGHPSDKLLPFFLILSGSLSLLYPFIFQGLLHLSTSIFANTLSLILVSFSVLCPLLICVGSIFPLTWEMLEKENTHHGEILGRMTFMNKLGCALGALIVPFILVPLFGLGGSFLVVSLGYFTLAWYLSSSKWIFSVPLIIVLFFFLPVPVKLDPTSRLIDLYQGADGVTAIYEDQYSSKHILSNQHYSLNGTQASLLSQKQESWIPLLLHPHPKEVIFIGMASGISAAAALDFPIQKLSAVELVKDVVKGAQLHFSEWNKKLFHDPRAEVIIEDGRRFIESKDDMYDVMIVTLLQPDQAGTASLYSKDFFAQALKKLRPDGLFCLWLPSFQMDAEIAGVVIKTFLDSFPQTLMIRGNLSPVETVVGLIGSNSPLNLNSTMLDEKLRSLPEIQKQSPHFESAANFATLILGDLKKHQDKFTSYPLNTDNHPVISFIGPKFLNTGERLRGINHLKWLDQYLPTDNDSSALNRAMRAGKYYFAAKVYEVHIPSLSFQEQSKRIMQHQEALKIAQDIYPESTLK